MRTSSLKRKTNETDISVSINLDGTGNCDIKTDIPFLNHMLTAFSLYSGIDLTITATGDVEVDDHHLVEDIGIVLGSVFQKALQDKVGITRFSETITPMDEALVRVVLDISNRPYLDFNGTFKRDQIGGLSLENIYEFLYAFAMESRVTLHIDVLKGQNDHHKAEAIFKGLGRAINVAKEVKSTRLPSTKGTLS